MSRMLVTLGDATDIRTRGGFPYFLYAAGQKQGFFDAVAALPLDGRERSRRTVWNLWRLLVHRERGGFQYSPRFAEWLFREANLQVSSDEVLSQFPFFPPESWLSRARVSYYIDATMRQNFDAYGLNRAVGPKMREYVLSREKRRYELAERIICRCRWAAESLVADYGVPASKLHVVVGGANVDETMLDQIEPLPAARPTPVRLGFIGGDWQRKNLLFLLEIADAVAALGVPVEVWAAGFAPHRGPSHPRLRAMGFIDKGRDMKRFVEFIRSLHFGCLFSKAEFAPRFTLECLRLGVPVLTWDVGGIADTVPDDLGHVFQADSTAGAIAEHIVRYARDESAYASLRARVAERVADFSWGRAVEQLREVWSGSPTYRFDAPRLARSSP